MDRLITHNIMIRASGGPASTTNNFPLRLDDEKVGLQRLKFHSRLTGGFFAQTE